MTLTPTFSRAPRIVRTATATPGRLLQAAAPRVRHGSLAARLPVPGQHLHTSASQSHRHALVPSNAVRAADGDASPRAAPPAVEPETSGTLLPQAYHSAANQTLEDLQDRFDAFIEAVPDLVQDTRAREAEWDIEAASGVVNVTLGPWGTYVINKQPATQQIWLSSPLTGPYRMDYRPPQGGETHSWISHREGQGDVELWGLFRSELARIVGEEEVHEFFDAPGA